MRIAIPTYRRTLAQHTLASLPFGRFKDTVLVVDRVDAAVFAEHPGLTFGAQVVTAPDEADSIAKTRAWILREAAYNPDSPLYSERLVMLDDDLRFSVRSETDFSDWVLTQADEDDIDKWLDWLDAALSVYVHAGWSMRQGNNTLKEPEIECWRMCYVLGYRPREVLENAELGRIETREDMDLTLQLLSKGLPNLVAACIAADQVAGYDGEGGASATRTVERSNADAERLAELHPGLVTVLEKDYLASVPRKEVRCYWKKAYRRSFK